MSFALPIALLLGLLLALPLWAHFRNRGKPKSVTFPGARFVAEASHQAKERRKISDHWLLILRSLLILALVLLAASPIIRIERLGFARQGGAAVALAVVLDDSASMNALVSGKSRFERAKAAALELIDSMRPEDSMSIVLAGKPARQLAAPGQSPSELRQLVSQLASSDRGTDLNQALELAKNSITHLPQPQKSFIALSDRSVKKLTITAESYSFPLGELTEPLSNCGILEALQTSATQIEIEISCNQPQALESRRLEIYAGAPLSEGRAIESLRTGEPLAQVSAREGRLSLSLESEVSGQQPLFVYMTPGVPPTSDQIEEDNALWVTQSAASLRAGVLADRRSAGTINKASSLLAVALKALDQPLLVEPLATLPSHREEMKHFSLLVIDDPAGLTPEERKLIEAWVSDGGVLAGFLGPALNDMPLGSSPEPFALTGSTWEYYAPAAQESARAISPESTPILDDLLETWNPLQAQGRALLSLGPDTQVRAKFKDARPFWGERILGKGLIVSLALPSSPGQSDVSLRPAFIALLARISKSVLERRGNLGGRVGEPFLDRLTPQTSVPAQDNLVASPRAEGLEIHRAARVAFIGSEGLIFRNFSPIREEMLLQPIKISQNQEQNEAVSSIQPIEIPREIAWFALAAMLAELLLRVLKLGRRSSIESR